MYFSRSTIVWGGSIALKFPTVSILSHSSLGVAKGTGGRETLHGTIQFQLELYLKVKAVITLFDTILFCIRDCGCEESGQVLVLGSIQHSRPDRLCWLKMRSLMVHSMKHHTAMLLTSQEEWRTRSYEG